MALRLSTLCADRPLPPGRFLVLISPRGLVDARAIMRLEGLGKLKKNHLIGTPACSTVPQPTTLPRIRNMNFLTCNAASTWGICSASF
jgi:hypothetical protein